VAVRTLLSGRPGPLGGSCRTALAFEAAHVHERERGGGGAAARFYKLAAAEVAAVYDDVGWTLTGSKSRSRQRRGHNGVASLLQHLGDGFARYRLGVGPRQPPEIDLKDFVLSKFSTEQHTIIETKLDSYVHGLELLLERGRTRP